MSGFLTSRLLREQGTPEEDIVTQFPTDVETQSKILDIDLDGIITPSVNEKGPERRDMSPQGTIRRLEYTINQQKEKIDDIMIEIAERDMTISRNTRIRKITSTVSFVIGVVISGAGVSFYGQISPDSSLQESISSVARKFSSDNTGYEFVQEGKAMALDLQNRRNEIVKLTTANDALNKIVKIQKDLSANQEERIAMCNKDLEGMKKPHK